jgi:hypothetical protein
MSTTWKGNGSVYHSPSQSVLLIFIKQPDEKRASRLKKEGYRLKSLELGLDPAIMGPSNPVALRRFMPTARQ